MNDVDTILQQVNTILGVVGSFVYLDEGKVVAQLASRYTDEQAQRAARVAHQALRTLETSGVRLTDVALAFGQGYVVLKNLRGGVLGIVCARNVNLPLLHLNANVAAKKLSDVLRPRAPISRRKVEAVVTPVASVSEETSFLELETEWRRIMREAMPAQITLRVMGELGTWLCCPRAPFLNTTAPEIFEFWRARCAAPSPPAFVRHTRLSNHPIFRRVCARDAPYLHTSTASVYSRCVRGYFCDVSYA